MFQNDLLIDMSYSKRFLRWHTICYVFFFVIKLIGSQLLREKLPRQRKVSPFNIGFYQFKVLFHIRIATLWWLFLGNRHIPKYGNPTSSYILRLSLDEKQRNLQRSEVSSAPQV